ncbi:MAG: DUF4065 domain-containing protein [Burkholderiaceae bacterium]|nr:DUF4065 domain-containing protein [Burkholderiaceae bacterium]
MKRSLFSERKAAQVAAYFLFRAGGTLPVLSLMKLMYLAERRSFQKFGEPIIGDKLVSMDQGPVLSRTLNFINGFVASEEGGWESWVSDRKNHDVALRRSTKIESPEESLLELSDGDLLVLDEIWTQLGHLDKWALRDYTHKYCPEWEDPDGSSIPIPYARLFEALGFSAEQREALTGRLSAQEYVQAVLSDC